MRATGSPDMRSAPPIVFSTLLLAGLALAVFAWILPEVRTTERLAEEVARISEANAALTKRLEHAVAVLRVYREDPQLALEVDFRNKGWLAPDEVLISTGWKNPDDMETGVENHTGMTLTTGEGG